MLQTIAAQVARHAPNEGETPTRIAGMSLLRIDTPAVLQRGILRPSCCVVVQGNKVSQAGTETMLRYGAGNFLVASLDVPIAGQVLHATRAKPFLCVRFDLTPHDILSVLEDTHLQVDASASTPAAFVGVSDAKLLDVVARSVSALDDEREAQFLAPMLRRELVYRLVTGPSAAAVCQSALLARVDEGVGRAVDWIKHHFKEPLTIEALARYANMSTSSLHHKFKAVVMIGPLQYQKRLRLEEARRLLVSGSADATSAAFAVGYESTSQFTREYRRLFGLPPLRDVKRMQDQARSLREPARGQGGASLSFGA